MFIDKLFGIKFDDGSGKEYLVLIINILFCNIFIIEENL